MRGIIISKLILFVIAVVLMIPMAPPSGRWYCWQTYPAQCFHVNEGNDKAKPMPHAPKFIHGVTHRW